MSTVCSEVQALSRSISSILIAAHLRRLRVLITECTVLSCRDNMIKGSEIRKADHPIEALLLDRWSPRAMSGEEIPHEELMRLFEAARWAPSSFNAQQWRALYARRSSEHWPVFFELLVEANKSWAKNAAALIVFIFGPGFSSIDALANKFFWRSGAPTKSSA